MLFWILFGLAFVMKTGISVVAFVKKATLVGWAFAVTAGVSLLYPVVCVIDGLYGSRLMEGTSRVVEASSLVSYAIMLAYVLKLRSGKTGIATGGSDCT